MTRVITLMDRLGLGFRRLSIIDLEGGHQPMSDRERTVWVVFNGEIYNFPELKRELESHGHVFRTRAIPKSSSTAINNGVRKYLAVSTECSDWRSGMYGTRG